MLIMMRDRHILLLLLEQEGDYHCDERMKSPFEKTIFNYSLEGNAHYSERTKSFIIIIIIKRRRR